MGWRAGILKLDGSRDSNNFSSKAEAEEWVLKQADRGIKKSIIVNTKNIKERFYETWEI